MEQSLAGLISDRATDEVVEALTRYRRGLGISDSPSMHFDDHQTPDVVRSRSSQVSDFVDATVAIEFHFNKNAFQDTMGFAPLRNLDLPRFGLDSPTVSLELI